MQAARTQRIGRLPRPKVVLTGPQSTLPSGLDTAPHRLNRFDEVFADANGIWCGSRTKPASRHRPTAILPQRARRQYWRSDFTADLEHTRVRIFRALVAS